MCFLVGKKYNITINLKYLQFLIKRDDCVCVYCIQKYMKHIYLSIERKILQKDCKDYLYKLYNNREDYKKDRKDEQKTKQIKIKRNYKIYHKETLRHQRKQ